MSIPVAVPPRMPLPWPAQVTTRLAVAVARPLSRLRPHALRRVLVLASRGARPATAATAARARQAVVTVSVRCAGHGCLQRSIAAALLCRLGGTWPDWCTGVRALPFGAHAWIEVDGTAIGETDDIIHYRTVLSVRCASGGAR
jgi:hypothetical protein